MIAPSVLALMASCLTLTGPAYAQADPGGTDPGDCPEQACPDPSWEAPRLSVAYDFLPGPHRPFQVVVEPISWNAGGWNLGPLLALTAPVSLQPGLELDAWQVQLGAWWMPGGPTLRWRVGAELGLGLRSFTDGETEIMRDWLPAVGGRLGASWVVLERWRVEAGLRLVGELPPTQLLLDDELLSVPTWRAQFLLGIHLPSPGR